MKYRRFGRLNWPVSALGFGTMRLPTKNGNDAVIDEEEATRMLHFAIDQGVNYIDTAYNYHRGESERFVGRALKGGYRERARLATKMPCWEVKSKADLDRILNEQLQKLQVEQVDFYLLHALNKQSWTKMYEMDALDWLEKVKKEGKIDRIGFSFHDDYPVFKEIIDSYSWDFCQIQYNYMDTENQAGTEGLKYAAAKEIAVVIMEPLLGGKLVDPPARIQKLWETAKIKRSAADWGLQWLWNQPEVAVVLSGMSDMSQVRENIASAAKSGVNSLTEEELALIQRVRAEYEKLSPIPCTRCRYCMPCPNGVDIPQNFSIYNEGVIYDKEQNARGDYLFMSEEVRAANCLNCRVCEEKCPQKISIGEWMATVHRKLG